MSTIHDKDSVVSLLERLGRVCREVKGLPEFVKRSMALNAGLLETDLDELEGLVEQAKEHVEDDLHGGDGYYEASELHSYGYIHESEINCKDNFELILDAIRNLHRASSDDQEKLILEVLKKQDVISEATELSALLHKTDLNIRCIDTETLETVLTVLRNPFNAELADKIHGETNEIGF